MKKLSQFVLVPAFALPALAVIACSSSDPAADGGQAGSATSSGAGHAGSVAQAGGPAQGGSTSVGGAGAGGAASGGAGAGGSSPAGGTSAGGSGGGGSGGVSSGGGTAAAGAAGTAGGAGQGGSGGAGGSSSTEVAQALDGVRIDDPCAGTADTSTGAVCPHVVLTGAGFKAAKEVTIGGTPGTTYDVTLRVRGIVESMQIDGGTRADTTTFQYQNMPFRKVPFTVGGTVNKPDYSQWRITVASPKQEYFLNDYQKVGHYIFKIDYQVTIPMAANSKVTLDDTDSNERLIDNYEKYTFEGIPGSMNYGQFIQLNVISVKPR